MKRRLLLIGAAGLLTLGGAFSTMAAQPANPRAADMDNAGDVFGGPYDNAVTQAVPHANGVVTTPAGGGKSPLCKITVTGLLPNTQYAVFVDTNGWAPGDVGSEGPFELGGFFVTNNGGNGQYRCESAIGDGAAVYINDWSNGNQGTVLVSDNVNDL